MADAKKSKVPLIILLAILVAGVGYLYSEHSKQQAVNEAMRQAEDACATGNRFLLDAKIVEAQSVFREKLSVEDAYDAENRLNNRLVYLGCKKY